MIININFNKGKQLSGRVYPEFFAINKEDTVLNVGCGDGVQAVIYGGNYKKMVGVDLNTDRLNMSKSIKEYFPFETICANVEAIPLTDTFDKIIAIDIVEHVQNPQKMLGEVYRLLKDGGQLLITFPTMHDRWENFFRFVGRKILRRKGKTIITKEWNPDAHASDFKLKKWFELMNNGGFELIKYRASSMFPPLHYLGIPKFWFSNNIIHTIDKFICEQPVFRDYGQAAVCVFKKKNYD